jgi:hypothetical protein
VLTWHAGLQNALDRHNFYEYDWMPHWNQFGPPFISPVSEQDQMPIFPDGGIKYQF